MTRPFDGQTAVTGSTSGIGRAIARVLAARGAHVIVRGRDDARGSAVVKEIRADGGKADFVAATLAGDIAYAVAFLASSEARMIYGTTLYVDGGITATRLG